jgi:hypothetical protein
MGLKRIERREVEMATHPSGAKARIIPGGLWHG